MSSTEIFKLQTMIHKWVVKSVQQVTITIISTVEEYEREPECLERSGGGTDLHIFFFSVKLVCI